MWLECSVVVSFSCLGLEAVVGSGTLLCNSFANFLKFYKFLICSYIMSGLLQLFRLLLCLLSLCIEFFVIRADHGVRMVTFDAMVIPLLLFGDISLKH